MCKSSTGVFKNILKLGYNVKVAKSNKSLTSIIYFDLVSSHRNLIYAHFKISTV